MSEGKVRAYSLYGIRGIAMISKDNAEKNLLIETVKKKLGAGLFDDAAILLSNNNYNEISSILWNITETVGGELPVLFFSYFMNCNNNQYNWFDILYEMSTLAFPYIEGSRSFLLYVIKKAIAIDESIQNLELILNFGYDPDEEILITDLAKKQYAEKMLAIDPDNEQAQKVLKKLIKNDKEIVANNNEGDEFEGYIERVEYGKVERFLDGLSMKEVSDMLIKQAKTSESMAVCGFIQYMIEKTNSRVWIQIQIDVMTQGLECMKEFGIDGVAEYYRKLFRL